MKAANGTARSRRWFRYGIAKVRQCVPTRELKNIGNELYSVPATPAPIDKWRPIFDAEKQDQFTTGT